MNMTTGSLSFFSNILTNDSTRFLEEGEEGGQVPGKVPETVENYQSYECKSIKVHKC